MSQAAFTNYATLMSKIAQHASAQKLADYALNLLQHYVSTEGTIIQGYHKNEKISLTSHGGQDEPNFVSIRSSAAVVLHNVAVEQLVLATVPNFGSAIGRAGDALIAAQNSLGPYHPWRLQVENTHHVVKQLCKLGAKLDLTRPLKMQVNVMKHKVLPPRGHLNASGQPADSSAQGADSSAPHRPEQRLQPSNSKVPTLPQLTAPRAASKPAAAQPRPGHLPRGRVLHRACRVV